MQERFINVRGFIWTSVREIFPAAVKVLPSDLENPKNRCGCETQKSNNFTFLSR